MLFLRRGNRHTANPLSLNSIGLDYYLSLNLLAKKTQYFLQTGVLLGQDGTSHATQVNPWPSPTPLPHSSNLLFLCCAFGVPPVLLTGNQQRPPILAGPGRFASKRPEVPTKSWAQRIGISKSHALRARRVHGFPFFFGGGGFPLKNQLPYKSSNACMGTLEESTTNIEIPIYIYKIHTGNLGSFPAFLQGYVLPTSDQERRSRNISYAL